MQNINDLTLADNMLFCSVMENRPDLAKRLIEMILKRKILDIKVVNKEKTIDAIVKSKSIRLDVYVEGEDEVYDIEIQTYRRSDLSKRSRYYHSAMDMDIIQKGEKYSSLKPSYVIFICTFDPFKKQEQIYHFEKIHKGKDGIIYLEDGSVTIFVNAEAIDEDMEMNTFLEFLRTNKPKDDYTNELYKEMDNLKKDSVWRDKAMFITDYMKETEEELIAEGEVIGLAKGEAIGLAKGKVEGTIQTYLKFLSKEETIKNVMNEFNLTKEEILKIIDTL